MDAQTPGRKRKDSVDDILKEAQEPVSRRAPLKPGFPETGAAATTMAGNDALAWTPKRVIRAATTVISFLAGFFLVAIKSNNILFTFRSDTFSNIQSALSWFQESRTLNGSLIASPAFSRLFTFTSMRTMFVRMSLPLSVAQQNNLSYAGRSNSRLPMWMGFAAQQVAGSDQTAIATFQGNSVDFFQTMRANQAALKFQAAETGFGGSSTGTVDAEDNGLERFLTATRRQNFLMPPRTHRVFPLPELF